jgi:hypothetical protein
LVKVVVYGNDRRRRVRGGGGRARRAVHCYGFAVRAGIELIDDSLVPTGTAVDHILLTVIGDDGVCVVATEHLVSPATRVRFVRFETPGFTVVDVFFGTQDLDTLGAIMRSGRTDIIFAVTAVCNVMTVITVYIVGAASPPQPVIARATVYLVFSFIALNIVFATVSVDIVPVSVAFNPIVAIAAPAGIVCGAGYLIGQSHPA